jgi:hypothetical protein
LEELVRTTKVEDITNKARNIFPNAGWIIGTDEKARTRGCLVRPTEIDAQVTSQMATNDRGRPPWKGEWNSSGSIFYRLLFGGTPPLIESSTRLPRSSNQIIILSQQHGHMHSFVEDSQVVDEGQL